MPELGGLIPPASVFNRDLVGATSALIGLITAWSVMAGESNGILVEGSIGFSRLALRPGALRYPGAHDVA